MLTVACDEEDVVLWEEVNEGGKADLCGFSRVGWGVDARDTGGGGGEEGVLDLLSRSRSVSYEDYCWTGGLLCVMCV